MALRGMFGCGIIIRIRSSSGYPHLYRCRGDDGYVGGRLCFGIGGGRVDRVVAAQIVEAVSGQAADQAANADNDIRRVIAQECVHELGND
jgi:hypothetical protein